MNAVAAARVPAADADLVARARAGDEQAWAALVGRYQSLIRRVCHRYRLDGTDADDVAQEVWLSLLRYADALRHPAALPGWLATTARRQCATVIRTRARHAEIIPDERPAGHPGREHRAHPRPVPAKAAPSPGHRRADQRRSRGRVTSGASLGTVW
jgi:RNA polymerase sigma factor (sigma-70 family)